MDQSAPATPVATESPFHPPAGTRWLFRPRQNLLLPPAASTPFMLLWVWLLPQALLLLLNHQAWNLAVGEMDASNRAAALTLFALESALLLGGAIFFVERLLRRRPIPRLAGAGFVFAASIYLAVVVIDGTSAIPVALRPWMLPPDQWVYKQFALVAPGALYGAFRLLCPDRESGYLGGVLLTLIAFASPFAFILLAMGGSLSSSLLGLDSKLVGYLAVPLYLTASTLAVGAVLRLCVSAYVASRRIGPAALAGLSALVALILPLAGLALNSRIPFPADFQLPALYILAAINGLVLTLPNFAHPLAHRATWLAQCVTFPFTIYFFAVFLPVLPLMPLAVICLGLGLLMVVPAALFLLHGFRILDGARAERRDGPRWRPALLALAAMALGPTLLTAKIFQDRTALHQALDYLQYPDYAANSRYPGSRDALRTALLSLRDFKEGNYLPFYSEFYNWLAFDNLLLPQAKLEETYLAFFGEPLPPMTARPMETPFFSSGRPRNAQEVLTGTMGPRPTASAIIATLETTIDPQPGEVVRARARLTVRNSTSTATEYRATIRVPAGVAITGMWLTIGHERVPARLFEERTALWVYQKITEGRTLQDPAILRFIGPDTAELRVFPVEPNNTRLVEIEFAYPANLSPTIAIDNRPLTLPPARGETAVLAPGAAWVPSAAVADIPALERAPIPHLIIDTSRDSRFRDPAVLTAAIRQALDSFRSAEFARITFANFDTRDFRSGAPIPLETLRQLTPAELTEAAGPFEGGFLAARALKESLVSAQNTPLESAVRFFPAPVILRSNPDPKIDAASLADFARLVPDEPIYRTLDPLAPGLVSQPLDPGADSPHRAAIHLYRRSGELFAARADRPTFHLAAKLLSGPLEIYDSRSRTFVPVASQPAPPSLAAIASIGTLATERLLAPAAAGPSSLAQLLARARAAGVLAPSTALMVVENSAQWKTLAITEKKTLKGHEALALSETSNTPEPGTLVLLGLAGVLAIAWRARHRFTRAPAPNSFAPPSSCA